ncbi:uncharacterized protein B0H18DRAFT_959768 [Fomitopsis serialis]|uniref:uncharacterized protein n=1 Tax=Fomitopsis serialis TaxID=139415 RepID=UPI002007298B|nr:uncharacterized protein B0H18DRAFT_959768 [Neoantrodia serialis]KAH9914554.1 hypothetical protein B0H18DRAFT_959768 [Neoantrodia serialis]
MFDYLGFHRARRSKPRPEPRPFILGAEPGQFFSATEPSCLTSVVQYCAQWLTIELGGLIPSLVAHLWAWWLNIELVYQGSGWEKPGRPDFARLPAGRPVHIGSWDFARPDRFTWGPARRPKPTPGQAESLLSAPAGPLVMSPAGPLRAQIFEASGWDTDQRSGRNVGKPIFLKASGRTWRPALAGGVWVHVADVIVASSPAGEHAGRFGLVGNVAAGPPLLKSHPERFTWPLSPSVLTLWLEHVPAHPSLLNAPPGLACQQNRHPEITSATRVIQCRTTKGNKFCRPFCPHTGVIGNDADMLKEHFELPPSKIHRAVVP